MNRAMAMRAVNWVDGMKVRSDHFMQLNRYVDERARDMIALGCTRLAYGLLEPVTGLEVLPEERGDKLHFSLRLQACNGITPGGWRILIPWGERDGQQLQNANIEVPSRKDLYVVVRAHDEWVPTGDVVDEVPHRQKDLVPRYSLDLVPEDVVASDDRGIPIGRVLLSRGSQELDPSFIPPAVTIGSLPQLTDIAARTLTLCKGIMEDASQAIAREYSNASRDVRVVELARLATQVIAERYDEFAWTHTDLPPIRICEFGWSLARSVRTFFICLPEKRERAELYHALARKGQFDSERHEELAAMLLDRNMPYRRHDIAAAIGPALTYLQYMGKVLNGLGVDREKVWLIDRDEKRK